MSDWQRVVQERIAPLRLTPTREAALAEELAQHLEDRYRELLSGGASEEEAFRQAERELDDLGPIEKKIGRNERMPKHDTVPVGDASTGNTLEGFWKDLRFAMRTMRKGPLFALSVVLTLGLGIGANTAVFTLINTLLLNPLPVPHSSGLTALARADVASNAKSRGPQPFAYADLKDYQARNDVFATLAGYTSPHLVTLQTGKVSERMFGELVTADYFSTLGLTPVRGRFFFPQEGTSPGDHPVVVLNYGTWQTRFGAADDIIGKQLRLNNLVFTVIGVAPPHFIGVNAIFGPNLWIPAAMMEQLLPNEMQDALSDRTKALFLGIGRLKPGIRRPEAQANVATVAAGLAREYPDTDKGHTAAVHSVNDVLFSDSFGGTSGVVFSGVVLLIVVGIVLLIACSNVANLLLARSAARQHEFAVRLATGASRGRLLRQLLTESVFLGAISGIVGLLIGYSGLRLLWSSLPSSSNFSNPKLDSVVFLFALVISLGTGFLFGTFPALRASRTDIAETLKEETHTVGKSRGKIAIANILLTGQVAFSFLLLMTAALFLRSIQRAYDIDPGFQTRHLAILMTNAGQSGYSKAQTKAFYKEVGERVASLPGVASVSWASNLPLWGRSVSGLRIEGREQRSKSETISTILNTVAPDYFETAGVALDKGRAFTERDQENSMPVAIINEKLAHDYWPEGEALGKRIQLPGEKTTRQIVGIARTGNYSTLAEPPQACVYVPLEQNYVDAMTLYVRSKGDPQEILVPAQREIRKVGPTIYAKDVRTGRQIIDNGLFQAKMGVILLSVFGLLALGLASIALYGIMAYSVNQRTREIGMRMALGAKRSDVLALVMKQGMRFVLTGVLIGLAATLVVDRLLTRLLYGVSPGDPASIAGAAFVLLAVALIACYFPAFRASRVDPLTALHEG